MSRLRESTNPKSLALNLIFQPALDSFHSSCSFGLFPEQQVLTEKKNFILGFFSSHNSTFARRDVRTSKTLLQTRQREERREATASLAVAEAISADVGSDSGQEGGLALCLQPPAKAAALFDLWRGFQRDKNRRRGNSLIRWCGYCLEEVSVQCPCDITKGTL